MKVIFLKDVKGTSRRGEVKEVSDGYAKNFLLPKGFAKPATEQVVKEIEKIRATEEKEVADFKERINQLEGMEMLEFRLKTGKKGETYGSVNKEEIENELKKRGFKNIEARLAKPIKELGEHEAEISIGRGITGKIKVFIKSE